MPKVIRCLGFFQKTAFIRASKIPKARKRSQQKIKDSEAVTPAFAGMNKTAISCFLKVC